MPTKRPAKTKIVIVVSGVGCALIVGRIFWLRAAGPDIERDAKVLLSALERGDGKTLYDHSYDEEKSQLGLTADKIQKVHDKLIQPRLRAFKPTGPVHTMVNRDASQAVAWQRMDDGKGHSFDLDIAPWATPKGGRMTGLARLETSWIVEYRISQGKSTDAVGCLQARIQGLKQDAPVLEKIGIPGVLWDGRLVSWDQYDAKLETHLAEFSLAKTDEQHQDLASVTR